MNNNKSNNFRHHERKCILRLPICVNKCHCPKCRKKKCALRLPVCIECPGSFGLENFQDNLDII